MQPVRIWQYFIDSEGHLWHEGTEIDDLSVLSLFMRKMEAMPGGTWRAFCQGEECRITAEDVPYVVQKISCMPTEIRLSFPGGFEEPLDPKTLFVGGLNVLYCRVRGGRFTARFNRKSYLELAKRVEFDAVSKDYYLTVDNRRYSIKGVTR